MTLGVDFDNTIVRYDGLFHRVAVELGLVPEHVPPTKTAVRDHLRACGREHDWTALQGVVYGPRMAGAEPYPGALDFFARCTSLGIEVHIISHKTRNPIAGPAFDLHGAARAWLEEAGFHREPVLLPKTHVHFETTKAGKLARIAACGCTAFIDDLPEILLDPSFPKAVARWLFSPGAGPAEVAEALATAPDWSCLDQALLPPQGLEHVARMAGILPPYSIRRTAGGANNRIFDVSGDKGGRAAIKAYFSQGERDRFDSERRLYSIAAATDAAAFMATPLSWDAEHRLAAFEFVEGAPPATAGREQVSQAMDFLAALNRSARARPDLPPAAEACTGIAEHLERVDSRLKRLAGVPGGDADSEAARDFIHGQLLPAWSGVRASPPPEDLPEHLSSRIASPSDFGFHNALIRPGGRLAFFDFEYAGWDDPAKLVCDFFCQPAVPVPLTEWDYVVDRVASIAGLDDSRSFNARCRALLPAYRIKWCAILLNEFLPEHHSRRSFARGAQGTTRSRPAQLEKARHMLASLKTTEIPWAP